MFFLKSSSEHIQGNFDNTSQKGFVQFRIKTQILELFRFSFDKIILDTNKAVLSSGAKEITQRAKNYKFGFHSRNFFRKERSSTFR